MGSGTIIYVQPIVATFQAQGIECDVNLLDEHIKAFIDIVPHCVSGNGGTGYADYWNSHLSCTVLLDQVAKYSGISIQF